MSIINLNRDYHSHSLNYSDGLNTIDEMVRFAGELGLEELALTDHSQAALDQHRLVKKNFRKSIDRWKNVHNSVSVRFGVEADLLNEGGEICAHIQGLESDFLVLSAHSDVYRGNRSKVTEGYIRAKKSLSNP